MPPCPKVVGVTPSLASLSHWLIKDLHPLHWRLNDPSTWKIRPRIHWSVTLRINQLLHFMIQRPLLLLEHQLLLPSPSGVFRIAKNLYPLHLSPRLHHSSRAP